MKDNKFSIAIDFMREEIKYFFKKIYNNKALFYSIISVVSVLACTALTFTVIHFCRHQHNYEPVTVEPTCTEDGHTSHVCKCGEVDGDPTVLPSLGHQYVDGECTRCNKVQSPFKINKVEFVIEGSVVEQYTADVLCEDFKVDLKINDGEDLSEYSAPKIIWSFMEESHGSRVSQSGVVSLADFIGDVTLCVMVESQNTVFATLPISVVFRDTIVSSISATINEGYDQYYVEGDVFDKNSISLWGEHEGVMIRIYDFEVDEAPLTPNDTEFVILYGDLHTDLPIVVNHKSLQSIEIVTAPSKTEYLEGQTFLKDGLVIRANYENSSEIVSDFEVDEETKLTVETTSVLISYSYNGKTQSVRQSVTVLPKKLISISVDATNVRKIYTRGDVFNPAGLVVKACFESYGEEEIFDYSYTQDTLLTDTAFVEISYTAREITKTERVEINVIEPYTKICKVKVLSPTDISISWSYSYLTDEGIRVIDNTAYEANGLAYDRINGLYDIPLGAVVTATVRNPAVINLSLNGSEQTMNHIEKTITWTMGSAELVVIKSIEMSSSHSVIRFAGQENEQSFLFEGLWNGVLAQENLERLSVVFADTEDYYHTYFFDGSSFRYEDLKDVIFDQNSTVTVVKNANQPNSKEVVLHLGEDASYIIRLSDDAVVNQLPVFTKSGYNYDGWSLTQGGEKIADADLKELLSSQQDKYELFIIWIKETVDYSDKFIDSGYDEPTYGGSTNTGTSGSTGSSGGSTFLPSPGPDDEPNYGGAISGPPSSGNTEVLIKFIGDWEFVREVEEESQTWICRVTFYADGGFDYVVSVNGEVNTHYFGTYRLTDEFEIVILSVETDMDILLLDVSYFVFTLEDNRISTNMIISTGDSLVIGSCQLIKIISNDDTSDDYITPIVPPIIIT